MDKNVSVFVEFSTYFCINVFRNNLNEKEKVFKNTATSTLELVDTKPLFEYEFSKEWIIKSGSILKTMSRTNRGYEAVYLIVDDKINKTDVYLSFGKYLDTYNEQSLIQKENYIYEANLKEREYLNKVFKDGFMDTLFLSNNGQYTFFYPIKSGERTFVLMFSDYMRYGKIGS